MAVPVLLYHQIAPLPHKKIPFRGLWVHPDKFRSQMAWLKRLGYQGLSLRDAMPYIKGEKTGKVAVVTFDDGFLNNYENALPVLSEFGFTATNYFVANQVGGSNVWDQAMGVPLTPCMSITQMREWAALGHEVGAHTLDHVNLERPRKRKLAGRLHNPRPCLKICLISRDQFRLSLWRESPNSS